MNKTTQAKKNRKLLYIIVATLVFEGLVRKLLPGFLSIVVFFLKEVFCLVGLYYIYLSTSSGVTKKIIKIFMILVYLIFPLLVYNVLLDPILLIWGAKTYLLYVVVSILMTLAFPEDSKKEFLRFLRFITILIIPTVFVATLQNNLGPSHWLNSSVDGESLESFARDGLLRVSSTFSFTGQFSFFLVFSATTFFVTVFLREKMKSSFLHLLLLIFIGILLVIGSFITGGRTAVLGLLLVSVIGFIFVIIKNPSVGLPKLVLISFGFFVIFPIIKEWKPDFFRVYEVRSSDGGNDDIYLRTIEPFTNAYSNLIEKKTYQMILGGGLGVMTNGSEKISSYASRIRSGGYWTETDFSTIVWEGGVYLMLVWYGFRIFIIVHSLKIWYFLKKKNYANAAAFLLAYIIIIGTTGTLSIQPPLAIYFWITFGAMVCLKRFDEYELLINKNRIK